VRFVGLADVTFPPIIVTAQVNAAERREMIEQENAQREVTRVVLARQLEEQELQRKIEVEKAQAEAEVNRILASSITPSYVQYHQLQVMYKLAESQNKVFVPASMLDSVAGQVGVGNQLK
jgi:regulator of protease activity HflC (stomatin/prohibitin superfamily)